MSGALVARDLTLRRGRRVLARGLSFRVEPGGALLVTGANGAGKSTLLRVLAGLLPAAGVVERPDRCALLSEQAALDGELPLARALRFWAALDGPDADARVAAAIAALALDPLADVPVRWLSTGQRRRAAFARVLAGAAPLWLLDEPASGLDAGAIARLEAAMARHRDGGGIAVVATHQPLALPGTALLALSGNVREAAA